MYFENLKQSQDAIQKNPLATISNFTIVSETNQKENSAPLSITSSALVNLVLIASLVSEKF